MGLEELGRGVRRAVVDEHDLQPVAGIVGAVERLERAADADLLVPGRQDDEQRRLTVDAAGFAARPGGGGA